MLNDNIKKFQIDSFFKYSAIPSQSDASVKKLPSSEGQMKLAKVLADDLKTLGLTNIVVNDNSIVTALLPKNKDNIYSIGFVAHLDTVDIGLTGDVHAQILKFEGNDLCLNKEKNIMFKVSDHPEIKNYMNNEIIFSDGTSVLGADNKAAISTVMSALKYIADNNVEHGDIYIAFVPDEEIGLLGSKALDLNVFKPDFAYTIDSCEIGEVVYETFNAGSASIDIEGVTAHPMSAKGVLVNPILIAIDMANEFDRKERRLYLGSRHKRKSEKCFFKIEYKRS